MKNLHGPKQANLILCQNANHPDKIVYYATKNAFVISERLIETKKPSTNARLLFVCEENKTSDRRRRKYLYYLRMNFCSLRPINTVSAGMRFFLSHDPFPLKNKIDKGFWCNQTRKKERKSSRSSWGCRYPHL